MKNNYRANVYPITAEDGSVSWCAAFPEFSCVVGGGDTPEEAIKEAYENLDVYLDFKGWSNLPQPTNPYTDKYSGKFLLRISKKLHRDLALKAEQEGQSLNALCAEVLARHIGEPNVATVAQQQPLSQPQFCQLNIILPGTNYRRGQ